MRQMSRLRAALRFFWFPLAARRLATVFTAQRRLGNAEPVRSALDLSARSSPELTPSGLTADIILRQAARSVTSPSNSWKRANW